MKGDSVLKPRSRGPVAAGGGRGGTPTLGTALAYKKSTHLKSTHLKSTHLKSTHLKSTSWKSQASGSFSCLAGQQDR